MRAIATAVEGAFAIETDSHRDARGAFARSYCAATFAALGLAFGAIRQMSVSVNPVRHTLRGMHFQETPEAKLVRVGHGAVFDVVVDLRRRSPTYLAWAGLTLDAERANALLVPAGCAHGFLTLAPDTRVEYAMDAEHDPASARGARWDDPRFGIAWPARPVLLSDRDRLWPDWPA